MADQPYIKWWTSDFLTGVMDLSAEETGCYAILLTMMADRGGPLPCASKDDRQWLARRCNLTTRAFNRVLGRLVDLGKLEERRGLIANRRMIAEIKARDEKSDQARAASRARWEKWEDEHPPSLPFEEPGDANGENTGRKSAVKPREKIDLNAPKKSEKPRKSADPDKRTDDLPSRGRTEPRARQSQSLEHSSPHPTTTAASGSGRAGGQDDQQEAPRDRLGDADLWAAYQRIAEASGHNPSQPAQVDRAFGFVEAWRRDGIDFDEVVIPTIRSIIGRSHEPTRTLGRFDAAIRHEHARRGGAKKPGDYTPPPVPELEPDDEDPRFHALRRYLLKQLGPVAFASFVNRVRFRVVDGQDAMRVENDRPGALALMDDHRAVMVRSWARDHGFPGGCW